jgi:hypothetical protein
MPYMFQFWSRFNNQLWVQSEVNLHKLRNKIVYASWNQKGAQMNDMQQKFNNVHHNLDLEKCHHFFSYVILCNLSRGLYHNGIIF